jgi:hypothetical protein
MRIIRAFSLAGFLLLCLSSSMWADSVTQAMVVAEFNVASTDISQNWNTFESSKVLQSEFLAGEKADAAGLILAFTGHKAAAAAEFKIALTDFTAVAGGFSAMPDAGALGLLGCTGIVLLGALKRKFSL